MTEPLLFPVEHDTRATSPRFTLAQLVNGDVDTALAAAEPGPTEPVNIVVARTCRYCGCTDAAACEGGCWWIADDVCSSCGQAARAEGVDVGGLRRQLRPAIARRLPAHVTTRPCIRCSGCGQLADDDDESPWSAWENLPPGSDIAVRIGLVSPHPCPDCAGSGVVTA